MDITEFCESLKQAWPPYGLNPALEALWWEAKGDWNKATRPPSAMKARTAPGYTPICIARKAICRMPSIGTVEPTGRPATVTRSANGTRL